MAEKRPLVTISLPGDLIPRIDRARLREAQKTGKIGTRSDVLRQALVEWLKRREK